MRKLTIYLLLGFVLINLVYAIVPDEDNDGVPFEDDKCPGSTSAVDQFGCDCSQKTASGCSGVWCCQQGLGCRIESNKAVCTSSKSTIESSGLIVDAFTEPYEELTATECGSSGYIQASCQARRWCKNKGYVSGIMSEWGLSNAVVYCIKGEDISEEIALYSDLPPCGNRQGFVQDACQANLYCFDSKNHKTGFQSEWGIDHGAFYCLKGDDVKIQQVHYDVFSNSTCGSNKEIRDACRAKRYCEGQGYKTGFVAMWGDPMMTVACLKEIDELGMLVGSDTLYNIVGEPGNYKGFEDGRLKVKNFVVNESVLEATGCGSSGLIQDSCRAKRWCQAKGYITGFQYKWPPPIDAKKDWFGNWNSISCLKGEKDVKSFIVPYTELEATGCGSSGFVQNACQSKRWCQSKGFITGFQSEWGVNGGAIYCINEGRVDVKIVATTELETERCHGDGLMKANCEAADYCQRNYYVSGFQSEWGADSAAIYCFRDTEFDWRFVNGQNWMTPVRNQGFCGSCWSFSAIGPVEAKHNIKNNNPNLNIDLSEQELVSCCNDCWPVAGCSGGWPDKAIEYVDNNGILMESAFPYEALDIKCTKEGERYSIGGYENIHADKWIYENGKWRYDPERDVLKKALREQGPLPICLVWGLTFDENGIGRCTRSGGGHAITLVGYDDAEGYWLIKNSWGTWWNEKGYGKIGYDECRIGRYCQMFFVV